MKGKVGNERRQGRHTNRIVRAPLDLGLIACVQQAPRSLRILPDAHSVIHTQRLANMLQCRLRQ